MGSKKDKIEKVKWTTSMEVLLIDNFHERKMLWDVHHPHYFKKGIKKMHMEDIVNKLKEIWPQEMESLKADTVRQKFANLRTYYFRELKKKRQNSGYFSKWDHFERMHFICKNPPPFSGPQTQGHHHTSDVAEEESEQTSSDDNEDDDDKDPVKVALKALQEAREEPQDRVYWFVNFLKCEIRSFPEKYQGDLINELLLTLMNFRERHRYPLLTQEENMPLPT